MISLLRGDCVEVLRGLPDACLDAVVTDTPYGLSNEPDMGEVLRHWISADLRAHAIAHGLPTAWADALFPATDYAHTGGGFMGKRWDSFVPQPSVWREVLRVLKPGAHVLAFGGTRTYDMMVLAMRLAGFEIRDQLAWLYGQGFPKSRNIAIDIGKVLEIVPEEHPHPTNACPGGQWCRCSDRDERAQSSATKHPPLYVWPAGTLPAEADGIGTAVSPGQEPIALARKPLEGTLAQNWLRYRTGGLNTGDAAIAVEGDDENDRWPKNAITDEIAAACIDEQSGVRRNGGGNEGGARDPGVALNPTTAKSTKHAGSSGGASRFFYCAKPSTREREAGCREAGLEGRKPTAITKRKEGSAGQANPRAGMTGKRVRYNWHPTVKPIALMRHLVRLVTPPGGWVLDLYNGSGTTGCAAVLEGRHYLGIDLDLDENGEPAGYLEISAARINWWAQHGGEL